MIESPYDFNDNTKKRYLEGKINFIIKLYYYLQQGFNQINSAHSTVLALVAIALIFRIEGNYKLIALIGLATLPLIVLLGWMWATRGKKTFEVIDLQDTTVYGRKGFEMSQTNLQQNEQIISLLKELVNKTSSSEVSNP